MKLYEIHDEDLPLLAKLVKQRLAKGEEVWLNINMPLRAIRVHHEGPILRLETKPNPSSLIQGLIGTDNVIELTYVKQDLPDDTQYKGETNLIINADTFEDLYMLKQFKHMGRSTWELVNSESVVKEHVDEMPLLLMLAKKIYAKGGTIFIRRHNNHGACSFEVSKLEHDDHGGVQIDFMDKRPVPASSYMQQMYIDPDDYVLSPIGDKDYVLEKA
jgi:hypothetical protein